MEVVYVGVVIIVILFAGWLTSRKDARGAVRGEINEESIQRTEKINEHLEEKHARPEPVVDVNDPRPIWEQLRDRRK